MKKQGNFDKLENFNFMLSTVKNLAYSQGFYGRLYRDIQDLESEILDDLIESLPDFKKDSLNVVFYFEC
jgi:hypothetical protein